MSSIFNSLRDARRRRRASEDPLRASRIHSAVSDADLLHRLETSEWLSEREYTIPAWLATSPEILADPMLISPDRLEELMDGAYPRNSNEQRYLRNRAVILDISSEVTSRANAEREAKKREDAAAEAKSAEETMTRADTAPIDGDLPRPPPPDSSSYASHHHTDSLRGSSTPTNTYDLTPANGGGALVSPSRPQLLTGDDRRAASLALNANAKVPQDAPTSKDLTFPPSKAGTALPQVSKLAPGAPNTFSNPPLPKISAGKLSDSSKPVAMQEAWQARFNGLFNRTPPQSMHLANKTAPDPNKLTTTSKLTENELNISIENAPLSSKAAVAAVSSNDSPYFTAEDEHLPQAKTDLAATTPRSRANDIRSHYPDRRMPTNGREEESANDGNDESERVGHKGKVLPSSHPTNDQAEESKDGLEHDDPKRKAVAPQQDTKLAAVSNRMGRSSVTDHLFQLADKITADIDEAVPNETLHLCGLAPIKLMATRPDEVLELAKEKLKTWKYSTVPPHWRRLYEDATLSKAVLMLRLQAETLIPMGPETRRKLQDGSYLRSNKLDQASSTADWLTEVIKTLDIGFTISGAPGRSVTFEHVFEQLEKYIDVDLTGEIPTRFTIARPNPLITNYAIVRSDTALSFADFQRHLDQSTTPLIIPDTLKHWPAFQKWHDPNYFLGLTLGGHRIVPVEIGTNYTDASWEQSLMTFREFMTTFVLSKQAEKVGYLAQHDLFAQIPKLRQDIMVPDYCWTTPPDASDAAQRTAGYAAVPPLNEPLLNAWFGPVSTKSPLHTDPYHNFLCQVIGYKYVRLYRPEEASNLYPRGINENGVSEENTSHVDVSLFRTRTLGGDTNVDAKREMEEKFPKFKDAEFSEGILAPGECLYIPLGWWHYVESLSVSISVSFWWN